MNEAEKLAELLLKSPGSGQVTGYLDDAAALLLRQAEQIKVLREALGLAYDALSGSTDKTLLPRAHRAVEQAIAATKEKT